MSTEFTNAKELVPGDGELRATFHTSAGDFTIKLFEDIAPNTVANFVGLATGQQAWTDPEFRNGVSQRIVSR